MSAEVIVLPVLCTECKHVAIRGSSSLECTLFGEPLLDEREAEQCMGFERT